MAPLLGACAVLAFAGPRQAGRGALGAGRGPGPRGQPAAAVHQPDDVQRDAGPGHAVRRPVHAGRFLRSARRASRGGLRRAAIVAGRPCAERHAGFLRRP